MGAIFIRYFFCGAVCGSFAPLDLCVCTVLFVCFLALPNVAGATSKLGEKFTCEQSISGLWEQYDDATKSLSSIIKIVRVSGDYFEGRIEEIIPSAGEDPNPRCTKCTGARKDKPVLGMRIITNLHRMSRLMYEDGEILDPESGDVYRLQINVSETGCKLHVRGYLGISLFGRSQVWRRAKP